MRKIYLSAILLLSFGLLYADNIDLKMIEIIAKNFMDRKRISENAILDIVCEEDNGQKLLYIVNFIEGGWVIVSTNDNTVPVLGYSLFGKYRIEDEKPQPFIDLIDSYKMKVLKASRIKTIDLDFKNKWAELLNPTKSKALGSYIPGTSLLDVPGRGHVQWSQSYNNDGGCTPSYHKFCPSGSGDNCNCDKKPAGCGAVAMGQIMWYWQWPITSPYRDYDWNIMPPELLNSSSSSAGDAVAHLLKDCGDAVGMTYMPWCLGSWATVESIENAFNFAFYYGAAKKQVRKYYWDYGNSWEDLIRSEIDCGRPVLYRGDKSDLSGMKHIFVIDGYDVNDPSFFWFNFGWGYPGGSYNISRHYLDDITPVDDYEFNENQMAIVGISPTYEDVSPEQIDILDVPYTTVTTNLTEEAQQTISLPALGKTLTLGNGADYKLIAGNAVFLNSGFIANSGSKFLATVDPNYAIDMDINVPVWVDVFTPNGDGYNDELCMTVENADSWEFEVFDMTPEGTPLFQSAGTITGDRACVWDGSGAWCNDSYECILRFKNSYGRELEHVYEVLAFCGFEAIKNEDYLDSREIQDKTYTSLNEIISSEYINIYPNPSNGIFFVNFPNEISIDVIEIFNSLGQVVFTKKYSSNKDKEINIENQPNGVYVFKVIFNNDYVLIRYLIKN